MGQVGLHIVTHNWSLCQQQHVDSVYRMLFNLFWPAWVQQCENIRQHVLNYFIELFFLKQWRTIFYYDGNGLNCILDHSLIALTQVLCQELEQVRPNVEAAFYNECRHNAADCFPHILLLIWKCDDQIVLDVFNCCHWYSRKLLLDLSFEGKTCHLSDQWFDLSHTHDNC